MSIKPCNTRLFLAVLIVVAATGQIVHFKTAEAGWFGKCLDQTGCSCCCPACDHVCNLEAEQVDEDISCFEVESKVICIPRVVFPWQKKRCHGCDSCDGSGCNNCVHNGARTRRICVLKTDKYTCPKCEYTWTPKPNACCDGCDVGRDCCSDAGCTKTDNKTTIETPLVQQELVVPPSWQTAARPPVYSEPRTSGTQPVNGEPRGRWSSFNR